MPFNVYQVKPRDQAPFMQVDENRQRLETEYPNAPIRRRAKNFKSEAEAQAWLEGMRAIEENDDRH